MSTNPFIVAGQRVQPGTRRQINLPAGRLPSGTELSLRLQVLHGIEPGPTVWFSGAIHGDEIVGVEIIRRILETLDERDLRGTIIAVPVVNVFGFVAESRYLPDRRDLNRSFPGSRRGSLASRLARLFVDNVLEPTVFGIDFHAGSDDRTNLPQVRGNLDDEETRRLAMAFSAPLMLHAKTIRGSLRETAVRRGKRVLLFEGGEPRRFNPGPVQAGADGALRVLHALEMIGTSPRLLALSLYRHLITDEIWAKQRAEYGYRDVRPQNLMTTFMGHPYIDIRTCFNSFIPEGLDPEFTESLADYYINEKLVKLDANIGRYQLKDGRLLDAEVIQRAIDNIRDMTGEW